MMCLSDRWRVQTAEDHTHHERNVSYRAMLQAVCPGAILYFPPPPLLSHWENVSTLRNRQTEDWQVSPVVPAICQRCSCSAQQ